MRGRAVPHSTDASMQTDPIMHHFAKTLIATGAEAAIPTPTSKTLP